MAIKNLQINVKDSKKKYVKYVLGLFEEIEREGDLSDAIKIKLHHGLSMSSTTPKIATEMQLFNESYTSSFEIDGLLHDIGRPEHYRLTGNLIDTDLSKASGIVDHGQLGALLLSGEYGGVSLLQRFLPNEKRYDEVLYNVVSNHTTIHNSSFTLSINHKDSVFNDYSIEEILASGDATLINKLIAYKIRIVQEADSLEMFQNIINGNWKTKMMVGDNDLARSEVLNLLYANQRIDMKSLKESGLWTNNSGAVLRVGLIVRNINSLLSFKMIITNDWLQMMHEAEIRNAKARNNCDLCDSNFELAYSFTQAFIANIVALADDPLFVTEEVKGKALVLTRKQMGIKTA
ncbi:MAG: hypothetical protein PHD02_04515 [Bacilli bacterium]|nr:hypothetical protein [Bacilli bacterium]